MNENSLASVSPVSVYHQFARLQSLTNWWHWLVVVATCLLVLLFVAMVYRRDAFEMPRPKRYALVFLRVAAFAGIFFFFLDLEKRSQRQLVRHSRALILVDTSLSMGIADAGTEGAQPVRRIDTAVQEFASGALLSKLREQHEVIVYRFGADETPTEIASYPRNATAQVALSDAGASNEPATDPVARWMAFGGSGVLLFAVLSGGMSAVSGWQSRHHDRAAWWLFGGVVIAVGGLVLLAVADLRNPEQTLLSTLGLREAPDAPVNLPSEVFDPSTLGTPAVEVDWESQLAPRGRATRLGDAVRTLVQRERDGPVAGIIVISDGGQNTGSGVDQAAGVARAAQIPLFTLGLGSNERPANARVVDVEAPSRVLPGDSFVLNGFVQSFGLAGQVVKVELRSADAAKGGDEDAVNQAMEVEQELSVPLGDDGAVIPIRFEVVPRQPGTRVYQVRLAAPNSDMRPDDDFRSAKVQIVERRNRVLLVAGGPTREFRFLRDQLYRDRDTTTAVLLQSGSPGMSQESDFLLSDFPDTAAELFEYDCIVAFDPDWLAIGKTGIDLLERWVSSEAGGLIVVAGPVHTPRWANRTRNEPVLAEVRNLYPVVFYSLGVASPSLARFSSETAWPLEFTGDGQDAEFLWLGDDAGASEINWGLFDGVYGYYAVKDAKPGARVYSRFSDPSTSIDGNLPIYQAGHFYGAGRVFFQASGEMWRLRAVDDTLFERYYTKLIRWVSQGRLLRDSTRGLLLVDKARCVLGDQVAVSAVMTDAQHRPLSAAEITASIVHPDGRRTPLVMRRSPESMRDGMFAGQFTVAREGDYRVELRPPGSEDELLTQEVRSTIPALETENPERNDAGLTTLAQRTGGIYYVGFESTRQGGGSLAVALEPQDQVTYVSGTPDQAFEQRLMTWLLGLICASLSFEWLIRRLGRLA